MNETCNICLKTNNNVHIINDSHAPNSRILSKLKICVPEIDWNILLKLCYDCEKQLNNLYEFKEQCIKSYHSLQLNNDIKTPHYESYFQAPIEGKFICYHCNAYFPEKRKLASHIKQFHTSRKHRNHQYNCLNCDKKFSTKKALEKHFECCLCKEETETVHTEQIVVEQLYTDEVPTCNLCGTTFSNKYLLKRHSTNVHATEKKHKCDQCERTFASPVYLSAHKRYHSGDRSHICSFCGKGFITTSDLYHHEKIHTNKRAYRCEICPKAFNTSSDLHKHKVCVHVDRTKWKFECTYCQRRFPLKTNLDTHTKIHTGEKNFACHLCDRKCINRSVLRRHIATHSDTVTFKCDLCTQRYKYRKSLDLHRAKMHGIGDIKVTERVKKYVCHLCPKAYCDNSKLQKHVRTHTGDRPFRCPICDKCFIDKSYVKQHIKITHAISENVHSH